MVDLYRVLAGPMSNFAKAEATAKRDLTQGKLNFTSTIESTAKAFPSLFNSSTNSGLLNVTAESEKTNYCNMQSVLN
jgi:hypothetical protein